MPTTPAGSPISIVPIRPAGRPAFRALPPLSLYIHVPWCVRKCPYCDFNSHAIRDGVPEQQYVEALVADLDSVLPSVWGRRVHTIFFGGGTPSVFSPESIDTILGAVRARLNVSPDAEITLEANPGTVDGGRYAGFRAAGVNRLSIGIQSFDARHLEKLGRIHDGADAHRAVELALACFDNVNLDLMYALPGQNVDDCMADLNTALSYSPAHLSFYHLTIEPNTYFHRFPPVLPDDDVSAEMEDRVHEQLASAGYDHYEVSAYSRDAARRCRHNVNYWEFGDYIGIGAGAHAKLSFPDRIVREARYRQPGQYMDAALQGHPAQTSGEIDAGDLVGEFMMNALRLTHGFATTLFEERTGLPFTAALPGLQYAEKRGLLERDHLRIAPSEQGQRFLNDLIAMFLPDDAADSKA